MSSLLPTCTGTCFPTVTQTDGVWISHQCSHQSTSPLAVLPALCQLSSAQIPPGRSKFQQVTPHLSPGVCGRAWSCSIQGWHIPGIREGTRLSSPTLSLTCNVPEDVTGDAWVGGCVLPTLLSPPCPTQGISPSPRRFGLLLHQHY